ncbi:MAG: FAD-dependent oxidoreductase, partial [Bacteroidia bacterium]|nr:FAD-dependent oxidoreductase [Bacteroidia bacterium]
MYDIVIIGGGLAGLVNAIQLSQAGLKVALLEKKSYPFHRVCGEYVSNETL